MTSGIAEYWFGALNLLAGCRFITLESPCTYFFGWQVSHHSIGS